MKAIRVMEPYDLQVVEVEEPSITESNEVKIRMKAMGICGSDMHILHGQNPFATYPRIIGHEVAGEVIELGDSVTGLNVGDKVVIEPMTSCGECYACKQGRRNVCEHVEVYGVHQDGGGREVAVFPEDLVHRVNSNLNWSEVALIEPFSIGAQAIYRGQVQKNDMVYIIGAGPIGLCCLKMVKHAGAKVAISDFNQERLDFAKKWGADVTINPQQQQVEDELLIWTNGMGANVVIDAVGTPKTVEQAVEVTSVAARVVLLGFNVESSRIAQVNITKKELTICGSRLQTERFPVVVDLFNSDDFDVEDLISHEFPIDDAKKAFKLMEAMPPALRKVIIKM
ncbi:zinc-binding alcohol dehydrogenase family protein [Aquibacillus sp. 3ASR75-11]|uniref:Zinc-binding alcohol dehydrogenase family protein n=1 Tax=Terrihalobacillus insolitus TaxID=2950438 RepID=A0A9X3WP44_9BACI|nr:zinc-binding alcohol dehydrogenase family protein [Terrihalobacillus insolitus]MDC3412062.1 zinc-binding alcohol dehydrogenase family protein [Terrihalobacillus insolitus]MDC3423245.1 zinc-binding alcohol dehydrogenase family protein [Terrihalobacillus insolitus]